MLRITFTVTILLACALGSAADPGRVTQRPEAPAVRLAAEADPIIGRWRWCTGNTIEMNDENRLIFSDKDIGSWTLVTSSPVRRYKLDWNLSDGHTIDDLTLTEDRLEGTSSLGVPVSAEKLPARPWRNP